MARRKKNEDLFDILVLLPWWLTLIVGIGIWFYLNGHPLPKGTLLDKPVFIWYGLKLFSWACFGAAFVSGVLTLKRKMLFASAKDIDVIRAMSWQEFERLVGEAYRRLGYSVEETGGGGADGGIDLILRGKGQKVIVQCKRWQKVRVDVMIVREMFGLLHHEKADRVIIVTIGTYTPDALDFARGKPIDLVNGKELVQLIRDVKGEPVAAAPAGPSAQPARTAPQKVLHVQSESSADAAPACPKCGAPMVMRMAKKGVNAGNPFWGCPRYPVCKGIQNVY